MERRGDPGSFVFSVSGKGASAREPFFFFGRWARARSPAIRDLFEWANLRPMESHGGARGRVKAEIMIPSAATGGGHFEESARYK